MTPLDFGVLEAKNGFERYDALLRCHQFAVQTGAAVSYKGIDSLYLEIPHNKNAGDILAELKIVSDMPISTEQLKTMREACPGLVSIIPDISSDAILNENKGSERLMKPIEESFADFYRLKNGCDMPDNVRKIFADLRGEA